MLKFLDGQAYCLQKVLLLRIWIKVAKKFSQNYILFQVGMASPITRFLRTVLSLLETGLARPYLKHLTELFRFLYDFSKLGEVEESRFLLSINTITIFVEFYLKAIRQTPEGGHIEVFFLIFFENKFFHF